jgi:hypothetical protein
MFLLLLSSSLIFTNSSNIFRLPEFFSTTTSNNPSEICAFVAAINPPPRYLPLATTAIVIVVISFLRPSSTEISQTLLEYVGIVAIMLVIVDNIRLFTVSLIFFDLSIISAPTPISAAFRKIRGGSNSDTILLSILLFSEIRVTTALLHQILQNIRALGNIDRVEWSEIVEEVAVAKIDVFRNS